MSKPSTVTVGMETVWLLPVRLAIWIALIRGFGLATGRAALAVLVIALFEVSLGFACAKLFHARPAPADPDDSDDDFPPTVSGVIP